MLTTKMTSKISGHLQILCNEFIRIDYNRNHVEGIKGWKHGVNISYLKNCEPSLDYEQAQILSNKIIINNYFKLSLIFCTHLVIIREGTT